MGIPREDRLLVQPGDMLGLHYSESATSTVVQYTRKKADTPLCCGLEQEDIHVVRVTPKRHEQLTMGIEQLGSAASQRRAISFNVVLSTGEPNVIPRYGNNIFFYARENSVHSVVGFRPRTISKLYW